MEIIKTKMGPLRKFRWIQIDQKTWIQIDSDKDLETAKQEFIKKQLEKEQSLLKAGRRGIKIVNKNF